MNYSTAIFLINPKVLAVKAIYEPQDERGYSKETGKPVVAGTFKTFDHTISVDDLIIVPSNTRWKMTVCKVIEVDVEVDPTSNATLEWVISTIDKSAYDDVVLSESQAINTIKQAEKTAQRNELRDKLLKHVDEQALNTLAIAKYTGEAAIPAPTVIDKAVDILGGATPGYTV